MAMEQGPLQFDEPYKTPAKAPPGAVAAAIIMFIVGAYGTASTIYQTYILASGIENHLTLVIMYPVLDIVLIYSGFAILKCRESEFGKSLWLAVLISTILGILMNIHQLTMIPSGLIILFIIFRYGGYIAAIAINTLTGAYAAYAWIYIMIQSRHIIFLWELAALLVPALTIVILLCLNWKVYKTRMHPKHRKEQQMVT